MKTAGVLAATMPSPARQRSLLARLTRTERACGPDRLGTATWEHRALALALLGSQTALALALQHGVVGLGEFAGLHIAGSLALAAFVHRRWKASADLHRRSDALQIIAWSALGGPFGAFVAAALVLHLALQAFLELTPVVQPGERIALRLQIELELRDHLARENA